MCPILDIKKKEISKNKYIIQSYLKMLECGFIHPIKLFLEVLSLIRGMLGRGKLSSDFM